MSLVIHAGAEPVTYDQLRAAKTPNGTDTHVPVPHHEIVELMRYTLGFYQHEIAEEHHALTPDGARYFGVLSLRSPYGDYTDMLGLRNSHDKSLPIGIAFGSRVFVCDYLGIQRRPRHQAQTPSRPSANSPVFWRISSGHSAQSAWGRINGYSPTKGQRSTRTRPTTRSSTCTETISSASRASAMS